MKTETEKYLIYWPKFWMDSVSPFRSHYAFFASIEGVTKQSNVDCLGRGNLPPPE